MNRMNYFNTIEERINTLAYRIESRGKINLLDIHLHSENFYRDLFNKILNLNLKNANLITQNAEGIDLIDEDNKILIQVSATATKEKIESSLGKNILKSYKDYTVRFIFIAKDAKNLTEKTYNNPHAVKFNSKDDIFDVPKILRIINNESSDKLIEIYDLIQRELGPDLLTKNTETNLATIIDILSRQNLNDLSTEFEVMGYEVARKISFNELEYVGEIIEDLAYHYGRLSGIYSEFDKQGANKSQSVLSALHSDYIKNIDNSNPDSLFFKVIECTMDRVKKSSNFKGIPFDELEYCVRIIVVDAFIRCKIYKNPERYLYAASRQHPSGTLRLF